jgi:peptidoglycan/LPS O-acetylase OafA/YrhL
MSIWYEFDCFKPGARVNDEGALKKSVMGTNFNFQIQILRGLTVIAVILFHFSHTMYPNGYLGVDVFFIISGYVIAPTIARMYQESESSLRKLSINSLNFIIARFERLTPTLALVVSITAVIGVFALPIGLIQKNLFSQGLASIGLFANVGAYKTQGDYFAPTQLPLLHIWSLSTEQQIYIFLPLLLIAVSLFGFSSQPKSFFPKLYAILLLISVLAFLVLNFVASQNLIPGIPTLGAWIYYSPTTRFIEFLLGAILSRFSLGVLPFPIIGIAFLAISVILFFPKQFLALELSLALFIAFLLCIILLCSTSKNSNSLINRAFIYLGDRSYSLYLWHLPVIVYMSESSKFSGVPNWMMIVISFCLITGFAHLSHTFIEVRVRQSLKNFSRGRSVISLFLFTLLMPFLLLISLQWLNDNNYFKEQKSVAKYASSLDENCQRDGIDTSSPCSYNEGSIKSVLLIGDSHAGAISEVVIEASKKQDFAIYIWTQGGCPLLNPNSSVDVFDKFSSYARSCQNHNKRVLDFVKKERPDLIIATQRSERITSNGSTSMDFQASFENYLSLLRNHSDQVLYIGPTPVFPESLYADYLLMSRKNVELLKSELNQSSFDEIRIYKQISSRIGVGFLDPTPIFCNLTLCNHKDSQGDYFTDGSHLSVYGARKLLNSLEIAILSK